MTCYEFSKNIVPDKLQQEIVDAGLSTIQYIETVGNDISIYFSEELSSEDEDTLSDVVDDHQPITIHNIIDQKIKESTAFGKSIIDEFTVENVLLGITQAGKTRALSDYCHKLVHYISTGSLYAAVEQIDAMIAAGLDPSLSPFITEARLLSYKSKIVDFLT